MRAKLRFDLASLAGSVMGHRMDTASQACILCDEPASVKGIETVTSDNNRRDRSLKTEGKKKDKGKRKEKKERNTHFLLRTPYATTRNVTILPPLNRISPLILLKHEKNERKRSKIHENHTKPAQKHPKFSASRNNENEANSTQYNTH